MNKIFLLLLFTFVSQSVFSQEFFLGESRNKLNAIMRQMSDTRLILSDVTDDRVYTFDVYTTDISKTMIYYNNNDTCKILIREYNLKFLNAAVSEFNKKHIRIDSNQWMTKDLNCTISITVYDKVFGVRYE